MPIDVSDVRSNPSDQIAHAARIIGRSEDRRKVFSAIYHGKKNIKTVSEILALSGLKSRIRVLQEAGKLAGNKIVKKLATKVNGETAYEKDPFYVQHKQKILTLAGNTEKLDKFPTKINPKIKKEVIITSFPKKFVSIKQITIDDIDSFSKVRRIKITEDQRSTPIYEREIKEGIKKILREYGTFTDWGGETDDLFSTRLKINGKRFSAAFGLKGKGTKGILTPNKMGKRGDQIQRLFKSPAEVFLVQYCGQIDESILDQMKSFATARSATDGKTIYFGIIDGDDTARLHIAYQHLFETNKT